MASSFEFSTPSPPSRVHTPQSPRLGYADSWEPFSPRKSARISSKRANTNRTPSPHSSTSRSSSSRKSTDTDFSTPIASPRKKRLPAMDSVRRASGTLTAEGTAHAAESLGIAPRSHQKSKSAAGIHSTMLPTPAKTPRKPADEKTEAGINAVARNLFHGDSDALSSRKRKSKKYSGIGLDSFKAEPVEEDIQIFTDSRDRIPELDARPENPFYGDSTVNDEELEPTKRRVSKRKMVMIPGVGKIPMEEAVQRDDGVVYVFRGKTFWKFTGNASADQGEEDNMLAAVDNDPLESRRVLRSSIKPRLLFPPDDKGKKTLDHDTEDEEAVTDIEDHAVADGDNQEEQTLEKTPADKNAPDTPAAPRFAPASPPTTARATRTKKLQAEVTPMKRPGKAASPFDTWRRSKSVGSHGQKREAPSPSGEIEPKRQRQRQHA